MTLTRRNVLAMGAPAVLLGARGGLRVAAFRADFTPPLGEPLIWVTPAAEVLDPLWAKGVVLRDGAETVVLLALDWCGVGGSIHRRFREAVARAAGTSPLRVALHCVHQHSAPYADGDGYEVMRSLAKTPLGMSEPALNMLNARLTAAVSGAVRRLKPVQRIGIGSAEVSRVASARRLKDAGKLVVRFSTGGKDPSLAAMPEGDIDTQLRTITLDSGRGPIARLHFYSTHPQTFCCDGRVSADFVGAAREAFEKTDGAPQVYFTGCAGDVTVGKYNDGSGAAQAGLRDRLLDAFGAASRAQVFHPADAPLKWRTAALSLPPRATPAEDYRATEGRAPDLIYKAAISAAFSRRTAPLDVFAATLGPARFLHLPGEPMLAFGRYARTFGDVVVAGYGDISPGYLCTDAAHAEGGYEPSASNAGPGTEAAVRRAITQVLG